MKKHIIDVHIYIYIYVGGWEHFLFFHNIWDNPFHWLIFFKMAKTTNQYRYDLIWYIVWYFLIVQEFRETNWLNDQCTRSIYDIPETTSQNRAPWDFLFIRPLPEGQWQHLADVDRLGPSFDRFVHTGFEGSLCNALGVAEFSSMLPSIHSESDSMGAFWSFRFTLLSKTLIYLIW